MIRHANDDDLANVYFDTQSTVGVNTWVAHRNRDVFGSDADEFRPERWLDYDKHRLSVMESNWIPVSSS